MFSVHLTGVLVWVINSNCLLKSRNGRSFSTRLHHRCPTLHLPPLKHHQPQSRHRNKTPNLLQRRRFMIRVKENKKVWRRLGQSVVMKKWMQQVKAWVEREVKREESQEQNDRRQGGKAAWELNRHNLRSPSNKRHQLKVRTHCTFADNTFGIW